MKCGDAWKNSVYKITKDREVLTNIQWNDNKERLVTFRYSHKSNNLYIFLDKEIYASGLNPFVPI